MTTAFPPSGEYKITSASDATPHSPTRAISNPPSAVTHQKTIEQSPSLDPTSSNSATNSSLSMSKFSKTSSVASGSPSTGHFSTQRSTNVRAGSANEHSSATLLEARPTVPKRQHCGMLTSRPPLLRQKWKIETALGRTTNLHSIALTVRATSLSTRRAQNFSLRASPSSLTQTTSAISRSSDLRSQRRSTASKFPSLPTSLPNPTKAPASQ